jgi:5-formyltetrahydrofolate cyclo-ligase
MEEALAHRVEPLLVDARMLGSYAAVGAEIDPSCIEAAWGGPVAFPRVRPSGLSFHQCRHDDLVPGLHSVPAPPESAPEADPDVLLVPLLLFDRSGIRLGQGGGHYDRTLARLRASGPRVAIGLAWDMQEVPALPFDPWDAALDGIATPTRLIRTGT